MNGRDIYKIYYSFAKYFIIAFYFIYSVIPSLFALFCLSRGIEVFFWLTLSKMDQIRISIGQILGFLILMATLPSYKIVVPIKNYKISMPVLLIQILAFCLCLFTVPAFIEMLTKSGGLQGRESLFDLSTKISAKYFLKIIFLVLSLLVLYLVYISHNMRYLMLLLPCVFVEILSLGRVWPFSFVALSLVCYIYVRKKFVSRNTVVISIIIFSLYSMVRLISQGGELDFLGNVIFLFGEAFNTQQTIELAIHSKDSLGVYERFLNGVSDYIPFGLRRILLDSDQNVTGILDSAKYSLYGAHVTMGFGSSWVSQYILVFGHNFFVILYPIFLALSLRLYLVLTKYSQLFSIIYLFYLISGLFMFFRYGLPLTITYPLFNTVYAILLLLILKCISGSIKYRKQLIY